MSEVLQNTPALRKMPKVGDYIEIKDSRGNDIFVGAVIKHNDNLYVIKYADKLKRIIARKEPLASQAMSWRETDWLTRCSKYITMVGTVIFHDEYYQKFKDVI